MRVFKKFTDFCIGFSAFSALFYLFREFMAYTPKDETVSLLEKLKLFLSEEPSKDYYLFLPLIGLSLLSLGVSLLLRRWPQISLAMSMLPLMQVLSMLTLERLYERPMLYVILTILHTVGCLAACIDADRAGGRHSAWGVDLCGLVGVSFCAYTLWRAKVVPPLKWDELGFFDQIVYFNLEDADLSVFSTVALMLGGLVLIRWLWRDLYFLDAALALIPAVYTLILWNGDRIPFHQGMLVAVVLAYAVARLAVMLTCKPKKRL